MGKRIDENIQFYGKPTDNVPLGREILIELEFLDKDKKSLEKITKKSPVIKNPDKEKFGKFENIILVDFIVKDIVKADNLKKVSYVTGWIDADDNKIKTTFDKYAEIEIINCYLEYEFFKFLFQSNHSYGIEFFKELKNYCKLFKIDTDLRKAHFIGQIAREVGNNFNVFENLNYKSSVLKVKFEYFSNNPHKADLYGRNDSHSANPVAIANHAYGNRIGNGSIESGDGWKYRGRGGKQLTGKSNYIGFTNWHKANFENIDFVTNPDLLGEYKYAARSAAYFWLKHNLYIIADKGIQTNYINQITNIINKYDDANGKKERIENVTKIYKKLSNN